MALGIRLVGGDTTASGGIGDSTTSPGVEPLPKDGVAVRYDVSALLWRAVPPTLEDSLFNCCLSIARAVSPSLGGGAA